MLSELHITTQRSSEILTLVFTKDQQVFTKDMQWTN